MKVYLFTKSGGHTESFRVVLTLEPVVLVILKGPMVYPLNGGGGGGGGGKLRGGGGAHTKFYLALSGWGRTQSFGPPIFPFCSSSPFTIINEWYLRY